MLALSLSTIFCLGCGGVDTGLHPSNTQHNTQHKLDAAAFLTPHARNLSFLGQASTRLRLNKVSTECSDDSYYSRAQQRGVTDTTANPIQPRFGVSALQLETIVRT